MTKDELKLRTKSLSLRIIKLVDSLPSSTTSRAIANQLVRSGMSVGANYRAACRARSQREFIAKLGVVLEELDESSFWMELIEEAQILPKERFADLANETDQLTAIIYSSIKTLRATSKKS